MPDYRTLYRLDPVPLGRGGQAVVYKATDRRTGTVVALKRRESNRPEAAARLRREVEVQRALEHPHVMRVLEHDDADYSWFSMPLASHTLGDLSPPLDTETTVAALDAVLAALSEAHSRGLVHRDIKPSNVLWLADSHSSRWVLADWGLVRNPVGTTTAPVTGDRMVGSEGFAPPEAYEDSHSASNAWDIYSIGRLTAWCVSGRMPLPGVPSDVPPPWRYFVRATTAALPEHRPRNIGEVRALLASVQSEAAVAELHALVEAAKSGDANAEEKLLLSPTLPQDAAFFVDHLAALRGAGLQALAMQRPELAEELARTMAESLEALSHNWGTRDFDQFNEPLHFIQCVAEYAEQAGELAVFEEVCSIIFRLEPAFDRYKQKRRTERWLGSLEGEAASIAASLLRHMPRAAEYFRELENGARSVAIQAAVKNRLKS